VILIAAIAIIIAGVVILASQRINKRVIQIKKNEVKIMKYKLAQTIDFNLF